MRQHKTGKLTRMACGASGVIVAPWQGRAIQSDFSLSPIYQATWHSNAQTQQISRCKLRAIVLPTGDSNERLTWRYITGELRINRQAVDSNGCFIHTASNDVWLYSHVVILLYGYIGMDGGAGVGIPSAVKNP